MSKIDTNEIRALMSQISAIMCDVDMFKDRVTYSTGEVKRAYQLIYNDHCWRLQKKIGQLWFYTTEQAILPIEETLAS